MRLLGQVLVNGLTGHVSGLRTNQELTKGWYSLRVHENEKVSTAGDNGPENFLRYLSKFIVGFLAVSIPLFVLVALFLSISPARLTQPFLLILATAFLVGIVQYFAARNRERPIVFSLFLSLGIGIYLLVFQLVVIHYGTEFGLIGERFGGTWFQVALLVSAIVPPIIFFRSKQRIEARLRKAPD